MTENITKNDPMEDLALSAPSSDEEDLFGPTSKTMKCLATSGLMGSGGDGAGLFDEVDAEEDRIRQQREEEHRLARNMEEERRRLEDLSLAEARRLQAEEDRLYREEQQAREHGRTGVTSTMTENVVPRQEPVVAPPPASFYRSHRTVIDDPLSSSNFVPPQTSLWEDEPQYNAPPPPLPPPLPPTAPPPPPPVVSNQPAASMPPPRRPSSQPPSLLAGLHNSPGKSRLGSFRSFALVLPPPPSFTPLYDSVSVGSPRLHQRGGIFSKPPHWLYAITTRSRDGEFCVRRRFKHFVALEERLRDACPGSILPPRPQKYASRAFEEGLQPQSALFAQQRSVELQTYLDHLIRHPHAGPSPTLRVFLTLPDHIGTAWPEVAHSLITRAGCASTHAAVRLSEGTNAIMLGNTGEESAEILALSTTEGLRVGSIIQSVPKLEGGVALVKELSESSGKTGMELGKLAKDVTYSDRELAFPLDVLSQSMLRCSRRTKRLAIELSAAMEPLAFEYRAVRNVRGAFQDRRNALFRKGQARVTADIKARRLAEQSHFGYGGERIPMIERLEIEAAQADDAAVHAAKDCEVIGAILLEEVSRGRAERIISWGCCVKVMASALREYYAERTGIWQNTLEVFGETSGDTAPILDHVSDYNHTSKMAEPAPMPEPEATIVVMPEPDQNSFEEDLIDINGHDTETDALLQNQQPIITKRSIAQTNLLGELLGKPLTSGYEPDLTNNGNDDISGSFLGNSLVDTDHNGQAQQFGTILQTPTMQSKLLGELLGNPAPLDNFMGNVTDVVTNTTPVSNGNTSNSTDFIGALESNSKLFSENTRNGDYSGLALLSSANDAKTSMRESNVKETLMEGLLGDSQAMDPMGVSTAAFVQDKLEEKNKSLRLNHNQTLTQNDATPIMSGSNSSQSKKSALMGELMGADSSMDASPPFYETGKTIQNQEDSNMFMGGSTPSQSRQSELMAELLGGDLQVIDSMEAGSTPLSQDDLKENTSSLPSDDQLSLKNNITVSTDVSGSSQSKKSALMGELMGDDSPMDMTDSLQSKKSVLLGELLGGDSQAEDITVAKTAPSSQDKLNDKFSPLQSDDQTSVQNEVSGIEEVSAPSQPKKSALMGELMGADSSMDASPFYETGETIPNQEDSNMFMGGSTPSQSRQSELMAELLGGDLQVIDSMEAGSTPLSQDDLKENTSSLPSDDQLSSKNNITVSTDVSGSSQSKKSALMGELMGDDSPMDTPHPFNNIDKTTSNQQDIHVITGGTGSLQSKKSVLLGELLGGDSQAEDNMVAKTAPSPQDKISPLQSDDQTSVQNEVSGIEDVSAPSQSKKSALMGELMGADSSMDASSPFGVFEETSLIQEDSNMFMGGAAPSQSRQSELMGELLGASSNNDDFMGGSILTIGDMMR